LTPRGDRSDDPFYSPDAWTESEVRPEDGVLVVKLSADSVRENLLLLHRAVAFARTHPRVVPPF
jgi:hypothetical protein